MPKITPLRLASLATGKSVAEIYQKVEYLIADYDGDSEGYYRCSDYPDDLVFSELIEYYSSRKGLRVRTALLLSKILGI